MSRVSCDSPSLLDSLHVDHQLELPPVITPNAGQSDTSVHDSPTVLFNRDKILSEALTRRRSNEGEKKDLSKDEKLQCSTATGQKPPGDANLYSSAIDAQERTPFEQTRPTSANEKLTEDESLLRSADERPHEGKSLLSSPDETFYQDKTPQHPTAGDEERHLGEETPLITLIGNQGHFPRNSEHSVLGSSPGPITSQPKVPNLELDTSTPTACAPLLQKDPVIVSEPGRVKASTANGVHPVVTRPQKTHGKLQSHPSLNSQSSKRSKGSSKSSSSQLQSAAQEDCCAHCILACLFCEFLMLCNIALDCATCGSCSSDESCFCCCCGCGECADCEAPCDMDCGIVDACCESADCLEICMECCGLCFSS